MRIAINSGHSDVDPGAIGATGLQESDVALKISELVVSILKNDSHNALLIRKDELYDIITTSNDFGANLFVSIHCNAAENTNARGTETFAHPASENGQRLAECVQRQIISQLGTIDRGVKLSDKLYVLKHTHAPAVLVECEFISNTEGECMLADLTTQERFATAIVEGINNYVAG